MKCNIARTTLVIVSVTMLWAAAAVPAMAQLLPGVGTVMTYNVNEGTDFLQVVGAQTLPQFLVGVGQILTQVQGTNPPERMEAVARKILEVQPELLSLQEVDQWYTGTFDPIAGTCGSMTLEYDMLQELLSALAAEGGHYEVAVQVTQNAFPPTPGLIPPATYICVAVTDYDVVLARKDIPSWIFQWSNPQSGQFVNELFCQLRSAQCRIQGRGPRLMQSFSDTLSTTSTHILSPSTQMSGNCKGVSCVRGRLTALYR